MTRQKHRNVKFISSLYALYNFYNAIKLLSREECENGCWIHGSLCWFKLILSLSSLSGHHLPIQLKYFLPFRERRCCVRRSHVVLCVHGLNNLSTHSRARFLRRFSVDSGLAPMLSHGDKPETILVISNILCRLVFINCTTLLCRYDDDDENCKNIIVFCWLFMKIPFSSSSCLRP